MNDNACRTENIEIDLEERRRVLGSVHGLLLKLAAQREAFAESDRAEASELVTAGDTSAAQRGEPEG
jgi:hypothetical protein